MEVVLYSELSPPEEFELFTASTPDATTCDFGLFLDLLLFLLKKLSRILMSKQLSLKEVFYFSYYLLFLCQLQNISAHIPG